MDMLNHVRIKNPNSFILEILVEKRVVFNLIYVSFAVVAPTRLVPIKGHDPVCNESNFIASTASVIGKVKLGKNVSIYYGAVARGDENNITIGDGSSLLDNSSISASKSAPTKIGNDVVICPGASVSSCEIGDGSMVGMGAVVSPGAVIGNDCFIDAGAFVAPNTVIPSGHLYTGNPARNLRVLSEDEMKYLRSTAVEFASLGARHAKQEAKSVSEVEADYESYLKRKDLGLQYDDVIEEPTADVMKYYELTGSNENNGILRNKEFNVAAELAQREADELAADLAENEYYNNLAIHRRVGESLYRISHLKSGQLASGEKIIQDLAAMDPKGASLLLSTLSEVAASTADPAGKKAEIVAMLQSYDPTTHHYLSEADAKTGAENIYKGLATHAKALLEKQPVQQQLQ
jgi:gamma-carbonic anhydrase